MISICDVNEIFKIYPAIVVDSDISLALILLALDIFSLGELEHHALDIVVRVPFCASTNAGFCIEEPW